VRLSRRARESTSGSTPTEPSVVERVMDVHDSSLLDIVDHVLAKGVTATGDVTLGVAGVDLIYVRLSALLCAADRVLPRAAEVTDGRRPRSRRRRATRT
jgi:hypothetical protein